MLPNRTAGAPSSHLLPHGEQWIDVVCHFLCHHFNKLEALRTVIQQAGCI